MEDQINKSKRKFCEGLIKKVPLILLVPAIGTLLPTEIKPFDFPSLKDFGFGYKEYKQSEDAVVRRILKKNDFPNWYDFVFPIVDNNVLGYPVEGELAISKDYDYTRIQIRGIHPLDGKIIELKEEFDGENIIYTEKATNPVKGFQEFDNPPILISPKNRKHTPVSLATKLVEADIGDLEGLSFISQCKSHSPKTYTLKLVKQDSLYVEAEVIDKDGNSPKTRNISAKYREIDGKKILVEASLTYVINMKICNSEFPFIGLLKEK